MKNAAISTPSGVTSNCVKTSLRRVTTRNLVWNAL